MIVHTFGVDVLSGDFVNLKGSRALSRTAAGFRARVDFGMMGEIEVQVIWEKVQMNQMVEEGRNLRVLRDELVNSDVDRVKMICE